MGIESGPPPCVYVKVFWCCVCLCVSVCTSDDRRRLRSVKYATRSDERDLTCQVQDLQIYLGSCCYQGESTVWSSRSFFFFLGGEK
jgi:hypothetical protein